MERDEGEFLSGAVFYGYGLYAGAAGRQDDRISYFLGVVKDYNIVSRLSIVC
jgi:hypothetical protein